MRFDVVTIFPEMFSAISNFGVTARAVQSGLVELRTWNPRNYTRDKHHSVDHRPYGGGPGMVMMAEPLERAINAARGEQTSDAKVIYLSPQGRRLDHDGARELSSRSGMVLVCGRYEGVDERLLARMIDEEWSIGDYVLSGGEIAAMTVIDAVTRNLPGALGDEDSAGQDSFANGLLDYAHYTRPEVFEGMAVPEILLSGNHEKIRRWRLKQSLGRTWLRRPDLFEKMSLTPEQQQLLEEFQSEYASSQARN